MDLSTSPCLAVPFAAVRCRWRPNVEKISRSCSINDGAILLSTPAYSRRLHESAPLHRAPVVESLPEKDSAVPNNTAGLSSPVAQSETSQRSLLATPPTRSFRPHAVCRHVVLYC